MDSEKIIRYWILIFLLNGLFALVMHFVAPELVGSIAYYAGIVTCSLIATVITWRDPPNLLDKILIFVIQLGMIVVGLAISVWGVGYKLEWWGNEGVEGFSSLLLSK